jgi:hypothetical protein
LADWLDPFANWLDPFAGWLDPFAGWLDPFAGWVDPFAGWVDPFAGWVDPLLPFSILDVLFIRDPFSSFVNSFSPNGLSLVSNPATPGLRMISSPISLAAVIAC